MSSIITPPRLCDCAPARFLDSLPGGGANGPTAFNVIQASSVALAALGPMDSAELFTRIAAELALFAGIGFLIFAANDLAVDLIYFGRRMWRAAAVYSRYPRAFASDMAGSGEQGFIAILVPAWDEA